jgi:hypothetical protein
MQRLYVGAGALLVLVGCGPGTPKTDPLTNGSHEPTMEIVVDAGTPTGWIAIVPSPVPVEEPWWLPETAAVAALVTADAEPAPSGTVRVLPGDGGDAVDLAVGAATTIPYGCDNNQLKVLPLGGGGKALAPGVAWVLPPTPPVNWMPHGVRVSRMRAEAGAAEWTIDGGVTIAITRDPGDGLKGVMTTTIGPSEVARAPVEKSLMEGGDDGPMDLSSWTPGIPEPLAAWSIGVNGPTFVAFLHPGYEGVTLRLAIVGHSGVRDVATTYLYSCAF